jgi:hypothetical protein
MIVDPNGIHVSGNDLRGAIDSIIYNRTINPNQKPSIGSSGNKVRGKLKPISTSTIFGMKF